MNTTTGSGPPPPAVVTLTRAAKQELLRKMYSLPHWIDVIRLIGYQTISVELARKGIMPLAEKYGKEPVASASEVLVEIFTQNNEAFARLKPHVRRMAFQILGREPSPGSVTAASPSPVTAPDQQSAADQPERVEKRNRTKQAKAPAATNGDAAPSSSDSGGVLMQQYRAAKEKHPGMLLLFRMGDFFELFDQDAETASKLLGLTLTSRDRTISMAGFPHHQLEAYLHRLLQAGHRVAICEPVEESLARGPIRREVTRVVTPGTMVEDDKSTAGTKSRPRKSCHRAGKRKPRRNRLPATKPQ